MPIYYLVLHRIKIPDMLTNTNSFENVAFRIVPLLLTKLYTYYLRTCSDKQESFTCKRLWRSCYHGSILIPAWINNHIYHKMLGEIIYPSSNSNGATVEVLEWISNFIPHFTRYVVTYPCWDYIASMLLKWTSHHWENFALFWQLLK